MGTGIATWEAPPAGTRRAAATALLIVLVATSILTIARTHGGVAEDVTPGPIRLLEGSQASSPEPPRGQLWVATFRTIRSMHALDPETATRFFGPTSFGLDGWPGTIPSLAWASAAAFARDLRSGRIPPAVRVVMYDPENWEYTPPSERRDPHSAIRMFGTLALRHGYVAIVTPHPNLVDAPGSVCGPRDAATLEEAYLACGIHEVAARHADIVEIQAQYLETDPIAYATFVEAATARARATDRDVMVISGLSTNFTDDPTVLVEAWRSVAPVVDGHYLNVPKDRRPEVAMDFLRMVAAEGSWLEEPEISGERGG